MGITRFSLLIIVIALLIGQVNAANVNITPSSKTVTQGQTFNLNVSVNPQGTAIAGVQLNIAFNKSIINVNSVTEGNLFKQNGASTFFNGGTINNSSGTIINIFDVIIGKANVSSPGTFIVVNMTSIGTSGTSFINLSNVEISDPNGIGIVLNVTNGSVSINTSPTVLVISNIVAASGKTYVLGNLTVGKLQYIDRTYTFSNIPAAYSGLKYIKTANGDKASTGTSFLQFDVNKDVTVYVSYDDKISPKPLWLSSFTDTGNNLVGGGGTFSLYAKNFPAGHIALGGNYGSGYSMYNVVLKPQQ